MSTATHQQETYLPESTSDVASVYRFMRAHETHHDRYYLVGSAPGDRVELPLEVYRVLRKVVDALQQGLAVTIAPTTQRLTTQQAADLLGVSRPTIIKLLDENKVPFERVGTHRRVLLRDLLAFREQRRAAQYEALEVTAVDVDDTEPVETTLERLRQARHAVASRRREGSES